SPIYRDSKELDYDYKILQAIQSGYNRQKHEKSNNS
ncbi:unnamed protein product, partial [marine sediment metagenome]